MRQWRVGTLSMGIVLIVVGISTLYAQFNDINIVSTALKLWPIIFIMLGLEVLWLVSKRKDEKSNVTYDIFSIFIVFLLVATGLSFQFLSEMGLTNFVKQQINSSHYELQIPVSSVAVEPNINKLVIQAPASDLNIITTDEKTITALGTARIVTDSLDSAKDIISAGEIMTITKSGSTQFIHLSRGDNYAHLVECTLIVPNNIDVEIAQKGYPLEIQLDNIKSNWVIKGTGNPTINVSSKNSLTVDAIVNSHTSLRGNVNWTVTETSGNDNRPIINGTVKIGEGAYKIKLIDTLAVTVNKI